MSDLGPDTLRALSADLDLRFSPDKLRAHADAWDAEQRRSAQLTSDAAELNMTLRQRLEAAEKMAKEVARRCPSDGCEAHTLLAALAAGEEP